MTSEAVRETTSTTPEVLARMRELVEPTLRAVVERLADPRMRRVAAYQLGWCDADGSPADGGGKAIRPALAVLSAEAAGGSSGDGLPGAVAVELVHNFSLLHDDVMDRDVERRHRPTGWVAFGDGQAILAGNAMLTAAAQALLATAPRALPLLLTTTQQLIGGQSQDLHLERRDAVTLDEVLAMEAGKTAALLSCSAAIGAVSVGAPDGVVDGLLDFGYELGLAFQLVDDVLGVDGDPARTGKSSSSDLRAGKRSAPIVAALTAGTDASRHLADLLRDGPPKSEEDVATAAGLVREAGGLEWAVREAEQRLATALTRLEGLPLAAQASAELAGLARYVVGRDR